MKRRVKDIIENFWGDLFCLKGNAIYGVKKELVVLNLGDQWIPSSDI